MDFDMERPGASNGQHNELNLLSSTVVLSKPAKNGEKKLRQKHQRAIPLVNLMQVGIDYVENCELVNYRQEKAAEDVAWIKQHLEEAIPWLEYVKYDQNDLMYS